MKDPEKTLAAIGAANDSKVYNAMQYIETSTNLLETIIMEYLTKTTGHKITMQEEDVIRTSFFTIHAALDLLNDGNVAINNALLLYAEPEGGKEK